MEKYTEDIPDGGDPQKKMEQRSTGRYNNIGYRILKVFRRSTSFGMGEKDKDDLWDRINYSVQRIDRIGRLRIALRWSIAACAAFLCFFLVWKVITPEDKHSSLIHAAQKHLPLMEGHDNVSIQGKNQVIDIRKDQQIIDLESLNETNELIGDELYRTVVVPYARTIEVVLPDKSKVWLNSGSKLTFPKKFDQDIRPVYLEGEGYFDVEPDPDRPFFVHTSDMQIKVLGTSFNVTSYGDDVYSSTALVSGKIELQVTDDRPFAPMVLEPGNAAVVNKESKRVTIREENVENHIAWTKRQLVLQNDPLQDILLRLGRVYNVKIVVEDGAKGEDTFSGILDVSQPLKDLMALLYEPSKYQILEEERRIVIKKR